MKENSKRAGNTDVKNPMKRILKVRERLTQQRNQR